MFNILKLKIVWRIIFMVLVVLKMFVSETFWEIFYPKIDKISANQFLA